VERGETNRGKGGIRKFGGLREGRGVAAQGSGAVGGAGGAGSMICGGRGRLRGTLREYGAHRAGEFFRGIEGIFCFRRMWSR